MKKKVLHTKALLPDMSYPKIVFPNGAENLVRLRFTGSVNRSLILPDQNLKKEDQRILTEIGLPGNVQYAHSDSQSREV